MTLEEYYAGDPQFEILIDHGVRDGEGPILDFTLVWKLGDDLIKFQHSFHLLPDLAYPLLASALDWLPIVWRRWERIFGLPFSSNPAR